MKKYLFFIFITIGTLSTSNAIAAGCALDQTQSYEKCLLSCLLSGGILVPFLCA